MARSNPERRAALLDAALEVLAEDGARGLTFRAVDQRAAVPAGTASNYFANRDALLAQCADRVYERLEPDADTLAQGAEGPRDAARVTALMHQVVDRVAAFPTGFLALLELRLAALRRPELREVLTRRIGADLRFNADYHQAVGLPGDTTTVHLLVLALNWLILERLTLPDLFTPEQRARLVDTLVARLLAGEGVIAAG
ncbi:MULTISPECIES: TetR/AcrR family transcriptional regulator [Kitasatospora]|uniref:Putative TetR family transcriptional regulator n=1 Tax=Kitasatospora setae (strain ATCC 33774 / DSM 43861 / JCM 3304 / KCC A-0304 / NBRC 14216 / KM-6054) TaxID=452652 RepID=E4NIR2_KITSK|nr:MULTISPECIES: TetR/AcrR family transcriptional regulator [Kitasatospora]BAJ32860.1 putative TetR family transcriptional regulator [Kitasatospora setae KM-6054]